MQWRFFHIALYPFSLQLWEQRAYYRWSRYLQTYPGRKAAFERMTGGNNLSFPPALYLHKYPGSNSLCTRISLLLSMFWIFLPAVLLLLVLCGFGILVLLPLTNDRPAQKNYRLFLCPVFLSLRLWTIFQLIFLLFDSRGLYTRFPVGFRCSWEMIFRLIQTTFAAGVRRPRSFLPAKNKNCWAYRPSTTGINAPEVLNIQNRCADFPCRYIPRECPHSNCRYYRGTTCAAPWNLPP